MNIWTTFVSNIILCDVWCEVVKRMKKSQFMSIYVVQSVRLIIFSDQNASAFRMILISFISQRQKGIPQVNIG